MNPGLIILLIILLILYLLVRLIRPIPVQLSRFEIDRRARDGDERAVILGSRVRATPFVQALRGLLTLLLILGIDGSLSGAVGGVWAATLTIVIVLLIEWLDGVKRLTRYGDKLYARLEPRLTRLSHAGRYFFFLPVHTSDTPSRIHSEAELLHLLDTATFLEPERRTLIHSALEFTGLTVRDAMSGRKSIKSVDKAEVLGPLLLDELYKTGKQAFVVTDHELDTVVGILKLERLTSLDMQDSPSALKAMDPEVHFIDIDAPITDALSYLRSSKAPFLVVQDADGVTSGLLTLDNILRCLFEQ